MTSEEEPIIERLSTGQIILLKETLRNESTRSLVSDYIACAASNNGNDSNRVDDIMRRAGTAETIAGRLEHMSVDLPGATWMEDFYSPEAVADVVAIVLDQQMAAEEQHG